MNNTLYLGTFNSELFWRDNTFAELPSIKDNQSDRILSVMDELQTVFCKDPKDLLITRLSIDGAFKDYLSKIGINFLSNNEDVASNDVNSSICNLLLNTNGKSEISYHSLEDYSFSPYSIMNETYELIELLGIHIKVPSIDTIIKVNSKEYSTKLSTNKYFFNDSLIASTAEELLIIGKKMFEKGAIIIKDPMGVSGKGNLLVNSEKLLVRIVDYLKKQELKGKKVCFIIEEMLQKKTDFSCQLFISSNGEVKIISTQVMQNKDFAFSGIYSANNEFINQLDSTGYYQQMIEIGNSLFQEGYFGPVCIDSMIDMSDRIIPVIEINARKSMGLINHHLDGILKQNNCKGNLKFLSLLMKKNIPFELLLKKLNEENILYSSNRNFGILPLSEKTININTQESIESEGLTSKGRFYFSLVSNNENIDQAGSISKLREIFDAFDCKITN